MYQSYIYLDVRVLLSAVPEVFLVDYEDSGKKDILSANEIFLSRNNNGAKIKSVNIEPSVLHKVSSFVKAIGGTLNKEAHIESQTGNIQEPPDDRTFTGFSVKVAEGGSLDIHFHQKAKKIDIAEIRIEEDSGHLTRVGGKPHMDWTYAGCPSMRIKTKAEFELGEEASIFLEELYTLMTYLKLVTGDLGESSVRCNAFVSLSHYPYSPDYYVKLRNLNSFNFVRKAINCELSRQEEILSAGGSIASESRLWIAELNTTETWKTRQDSPKFALLNPDLKIDMVSACGNTSLEVELPASRRERLKASYGLSRLRTEFICANKDRADYFEEAVAEGADPMMTAHWMAGELMHLLNTHKTSIKQCRITSKKFASIMKMLYTGKIHSGIAKNLLQEISETGDNPETLVKKKNLSLLTTEEELKPFVDKVLAENQKSVTALLHGDMAPLEHLTGCVMKESGGRAVPLRVKSYIKEQLKISLIYVFAMGGAITAQKHVDGTVTAGSAETIAKIINSGEDKETSQYPLQVINLRSMLSEETEPADWAVLISQISEKIQSGTANGIVVTHGTDTLPYTAALLYWLYGSAGVPVVLTASSTLPSQGNEASCNIQMAVKTAREKKDGVYVVYGGKVLSPLNLKYYTSSPDGFINWNLDSNIYNSQSLVSQQFMSVNLPDADIVRHLLNEAASRLAVVKLYPGLPGYRLEKFYDEESSVDNIILELYASGTGNMRNSDYSLKGFLINGRKNGKKFYCTSQQECKVDFSEYSTSARVWREGAVPMGILTTESVIALFNACYLVADNDTELSMLMEAATEVL